MHDKKQLNLPGWRQRACALAFAYLYFATAMTTLRAQQLDTMLPPPDSRYLAALADTCRPLAVLENTVVQFNGYARAFIRVSGATTNPTLYYRVGSTGVFAQSQLQSSGSLLLTQLTPNSQYEVWAADNCGTLNQIAALIPILG